MKDSFTELTPNIQDLLFQTKKEQTFSSILAAKIQTQLKGTRSHCLVELKGIEKISPSGSGQKNRNTHDVCIVDAEANFQLILENKVWYHFDGAKGARNKKANPHIEEQLLPDIHKIRITALEVNNHPKGFIMICLVTPSEVKYLPMAYLSDHQKAFTRVGSHLETFRKEGIEGLMSILQKHQRDLGAIAHVALEPNLGINKSGLIDIFCAEVVV
jgi:hypothetical protein